MTKSELMDYLAVRRCSTTGSKHALVARAFVAWENKEPIQLNAQALKDKLHHQYKERLGCLPDPLLIPDDRWSDDVSKWPSINLGHIFQYILETKEFNIDYVGKYKTQKAYSYFTSRFVGPVTWTSIQEDRCFIQGSVIPSQSVTCCHGARVPLAMAKPAIM